MRGRLRAGGARSCGTRERRRDRGSDTGRVLGTLPRRFRMVGWHQGRAAGAARYGGRHGGDGKTTGVRHRRTPGLRCMDDGAGVIQSAAAPRRGTHRAGLREHDNDSASSFMSRGLATTALASLMRRFAATGSCLRQNPVIRLRGGSSCDCACGPTPASPAACRPASCRSCAS